MLNSTCWEEPVWSLSPQKDSTIPRVCLHSHLSLHIRHTWNNEQYHSVDTINIYFYIVRCKLCWRQQQCAMSWICGHGTLLYTDSCESHNYHVTVFVGRNLQIKPIFFLKERNTRIDTYRLMQHLTLAAFQLLPYSIPGRVEKKNKLIEKPMTTFPCGY